MMKPLFLKIAFCLLALPFTVSAQESAPLRLGVAGVSHGHLAEVVNRADRGDFTIVGVAERDDRLRERNPLRRSVDAELFFADLEEMLERTRPEAVIVYEPIFDHLRVVEACAPRGIHVMVEKPLAVSTEHARRMAALAREHNIHLLTNYETTWYSSNHEAYRLIDEEGRIGKITRMLVYDGHPGPIEIGCGPEFTDWLTDPVLNGGGAVIDFGCYGVNLATWLLQGENPLSVYGVLQQQKPEIYPKVDDDATILLNYPGATVQVMGSWNWPIYRKGTERLVRAAIQYAIDNQLPSVTLVHKGNIMKFTEGSFKNWGYELAEREFGDRVFTWAQWERIKKEEGEEAANAVQQAQLAAGKVLIKDAIADAFLQWTLLKPKEFSVIATPNLNGDYISDQLAAMVGGIGIAPGANINYVTGHAIFEATHGTAPIHAGKNKANPCSLLLSAVMMLQYMNWNSAAEVIVEAMEAAFGEGKATYDLVRFMENGTKLSTSQFADLLIEKIDRK